ncbi:hypothetical protein DNAOFDDG_01042 [Mannheimia haemolytica]|uniref:Uncharacterized protein n=1 Tax=Mannheimia haemolytica TaxID=75985 RepID=A0A378NJ57_MANHA|nr:hypothetical protein EDC41_10438 [Mannheimia haemolytica]STY51648.1 Uncharacterised protein [Mannheimia haemolytica]STY65968.1 Uncharacterised protein [Mannheimia haemolytica]
MPSIVKFGKKLTACALFVGAKDFSPLLVLVLSRFKELYVRVTFLGEV